MLNVGINSGHSDICYLIVVQGVDSGHPDSCGLLKELIVATLNETLGGKHYDAAKVSSWSKAIADSVKTQVKGLGYDRQVKLFF